MPVSSGDIYEQLLKSSAFVVLSQNNQMIGFGSGFLIDLPRKLVVTNWHVVKRNPQADVIFPVYENGILLSQTEYYVNNRQKIERRGRVVYKDLARDLALIELDSIPEGVRALDLSRKLARPSQIIYSIGGSGAFDLTRSGAADTEKPLVLWHYSTGQVRQVYQREIRFETGQQITANVIETQSPINRGDGC